MIYHCLNCDKEVIKDGEELSDNIKITMSADIVNYYCIECVLMLIQMMTKLMEKHNEQ